VKGRGLDLFVLAFVKTALALRPIKCGNFDQLRNS